jgi:D-alanine-D-alanine ligase
MNIGFLYTKSELTPWKENVNEQTLSFLQEQAPDHINSDIVHFDGFTAAMANKLSQYDLIFNLCYGYIEAGQVEVAGWLEQHAIPHTASRYHALSIAQNKALLPEICTDLGLNTPGTTSQLDVLERDKLYVAKPRLGSCHRNIYINTGAWLQENHLHIADDSIFQPYIFGREFSVAIIPAPGGRFYHGLPPVEIYPVDEKSIYIAGQNYGPTKREYNPILKESISDELVAAAELLHKQMGLCGMSRTDFRVSTEGQIYVLDVNAMPNLDPVKSLMPGICHYHGIQMKDLIQRVLDNATWIKSEANKAKQQDGFQLYSLAK